ncbi:Fumarylacetoacetase, protein [Akanthomyces lecanii RCEF 1005]|uniref:Fumarylacetoacetase, protein n=1 Tax=Akanthomyces lecanii RCEF 1005 TaxID=1081108 RepID=A0A168KW64_CORDF|nr:Fumarylacetoacetase, protein [Akanthomyces lecanii RCEF 1005]
MYSFDALVKFTAREDGQEYFAAVTATEPNACPVPPTPGTLLDAHHTLEQFLSGSNSKQVTVENLLAPLPQANLPIYCVGLNFRSHAKEAKFEQLTMTNYPTLWNKPARALANPDQDIPVNEFCATSLLDYEGELVFVTSKEARDVTQAKAASYILGYTIGNDLSCRMFQLQKNSGGQFFFAKGFDKFAPMGPVLISQKQYEATARGRRLTTTVNGEVVQDVELAKDMIFSPEQILSHMSQGTTIPAGTAIMMGTPAGVGAFRSPKSFLGDGDKVEVQVSAIGVLSNVVRFEK